VKSLLIKLGKVPNEFLVSKAVEEFFGEKERYLSGLDSVVIDNSLSPDREVLTTLRKMNRDLFSIDGFIEIVRSVGYSGWYRDNMAMPEIHEQQALPSEFVDYTGDDVRCESGSNERYSLRFISEPLSDDQSSKITTVLARSYYSDVFRLSRLLDKAFVVRNGRSYSGRILYGHEWYPLEQSPLVHNVNLQPIVITADHMVVLLKRSDQVHHYPGCWSASLEEQMRGSEGTSEGPTETYFECAERGVHEELACTPISNRTVLLSVGIEHKNLSASFLSIVYLKETFKEVHQRWISKAIDVAETSALDAIPLDKSSLLDALKCRDYKPTPQALRRTTNEVGGPWHPTSRMRLYALRCHLYGAE